MQALTGALSQSELAWSGMQNNGETSVVALGGDHKYDA